LATISRETALLGLACPFRVRISPDLQTTAKKPKGVLKKVAENTQNKTADVGCNVPLLRHKYLDQKSSFIWNRADEESLWIVDLCY